MLHSDILSEEQPLQEKRRFELISQGIEAFVTVIRTVCTAGIIIAMIYFGQKVLIAFAGKTTQTDFSLSLLTKLQADRWFAYLFGASGVGYGYAERKLRQRNIKRMSRINTMLETKLDPKRVSSGLTPTGTTRKKDR